MVDILVILAHPDDAELCCAGTLLSSIEERLKVGMVDLTRGELGTRGTDKIRLEEAANAAKVIGAEFRFNLGLRDGFISSDEESLIKVVEQIRKYQPKIIITNSRKDRHPDHEAASRLVKKACFLSGLEVSTSIINCLSGYRGVKLSKAILCRDFSGSSKFILLTWRRAKYLSPAFGALTGPSTVSPVLNPNFLIWVGLT